MSLYDHMMAGIRSSGAGAATAGAGAAMNPVAAGVKQSLYPGGGGGEPQPGLPQSAEPEAQTEGEQPTEDEQKQYDQIVTRVLQFMTKSKDKVIASMKPVGDETPEKALGRFAHTVVTGVVQQASRAGVEVSPDAEYHAGVEVVEQVVRMAKAAKLVKDTPNLNEQVLVEALDNEVKRQNAQGNPNQEEASQFYAQQVAQEVDGGAAPKGFLSQQGGGGGGELQAVQPSVVSQ